MERELVPIRARARELVADAALTTQALGDGAESARRVARDTLTTVRARMGFD
jgi:hypothetical protein